eukprot:g2605.t1
MGSLSRKVQDCKEYVICGPHLNLHTTSSFSTTSFGPYEQDHGWNLQKFTNKFKLEIQKMSDEVMEFDVVGIHASIANALRRIMISELPTMAIEHVFIIDNTGIVQVKPSKTNSITLSLQDELLAHRLGLVPIKVDPRCFEWKTGDEPSNERNCIVFKLEVDCGKTSSHSEGEPTVLSGNLKWLPNGSEMPDETSCRFLNDQRMTLNQSELHPVHQDILLTKLRPGQAIELEAHCIKGIGKVHAKWSPVATAWYRLLPEVVLLKAVDGAKAQYLAENFPGLFTVEKEPKSGKEIVTVANARYHEIYLEQIRTLSGDPHWSNKLQLRKKKDHFLYTVESVGQYKAADVFSEALEVLIQKCDKLIDSL